ncbi:uncharacterized protein LOC127749030 [Frankliniella occidentalis]|uniref:Uncharacterized protein LOC127749030 n=1 Tax=Frankliniella occidentalis TaxID=133901 RepID=A0A9C6WWY2_FRAOC|nr:uncharacterized protein LOC127749030 [Frankliniella occidentalis]
MVQNHEYLNIMSINIRSIRKKRNVVLHLLNENKINLVIITEHWLNEVETKDFTLEGFLKVASYSRKSTSGGGVLILMRDSMHCSLYRPPVSTVNEMELFEDILSELLIESNPLQSNVILAGDFNIKTIHKSMKVNAFCDTLNGCGLKLLFHSYTRINLKTGRGSCIDNICTNFYHKVVSKNVISTSQLSDHEALIATFDAGKKSNIIPVYKRKVNQETLMNLNYALLNENWNDVLQINDVNMAFDMFIATFKFYFDVYCPNVKIQQKTNSHNTVKWDPPNVIAIKEVISTLQSILCNELENDLIDRNSIIDNIKTQREQLLKALDSHYEQIASKLDNVDFNPNLVYSSDNSVFMSPTNIDEVEKMINELSNKKSFGADEISNYVVKSVKKAILVPLVHIINQSMDKGVFPTALKKTIVKPLYKKGQKTLPENY